MTPAPLTGSEKIVATAVWVSPRTRARLCLRTHVLPCPRARALFLMRMWRILLRDNWRVALKLHVLAAKRVQKSIDFCFTRSLCWRSSHHA
jgi:hypothetical protein